MPQNNLFENSLIELVTTVFSKLNFEMQSTLIRLILKIPCESCNNTGTKYYIPDMDSMGGYGECDHCLGTGAKYRKLLSGFIED